MAARIEQLATGARGTGARPLPPMAAMDHGSEGSWSFDRPHSGERLPLAELAQRALRLVAANVQADHGVFYLVDAPSPPKLVATLSDAQPSALVERWIVERLARELADDERTLVNTEAQAAQAPWDLMHEGGLKHRMLVFTTSDRVVVALAVLARTSHAPKPCPGALQRTVADRLYEALCDEKTERTSVAAQPAS